MIRGVDDIFPGADKLQASQQCKPALQMLLSSESLDDPVVQCRDLVNQIAGNTERYSIHEGLELQVVLQRAIHFIRTSAWATCYGQQVVGQVSRILCDAIDELELYQPAPHPMIMNVLDRMDELN